MIGYFSNFYKPFPPKIFTEFEYWLQFLDIRSDITFKERYLRSAKIINSVQQKLIHVLDIVDIPYLARQSQDEFYIYNNYFRTIKEQVEGLYNYYNASFATRNQYINKLDKICYEITIPMFDLDYLDIWPMGRPYEDWRRIVSPLYLHYHDSSFLTYDIFHSKVVFKVDEPNIAIFFIDIPSLCMKYFKWYLQDKKKDVYEFITNEVWSFLIDQLKHIWIMKQHTLMMLKVAGVEVDDQLEYNNKKLYVYIGSRYLSAMDRLYNLYKEVSEGKILAETVLNSKLFSYQGNYTFRDLVKYTESHLVVPWLSQYTWMKVVRDLPLLKYMINVYCLYDKNKKFDSFKSIFEIQWKKMLSKQPWDYIKIPATKEWFKKEIDMFNTIM